jgi:negative regulator of sigma E activity
LLWCSFISSARPPFWSVRRPHQRKLVVVVGAAVVVAAAVASGVAVSGAVGSGAADFAAAVGDAAEAGAAASVTATADMDASTAPVGAESSARIIDRGLIGVIVTHDPNQKSGVSIDRHT